MKESCHPDLIVSILSNVSYPWKGLISALLNDFKIPYLDTTHCEIGDFELNLNRNSRVFLSFFSFNTRETELCSHKILFPSLELFYAPYHAVLIGNVFHGSNIRFEHW